MKFQNVFKKKQKTNLAWYLFMNCGVLLSENFQYVSNMLIHSGLSLDIKKKPV